jgi:ketosteroid isomerase-like protein
LAPDNVELVRLAYQAMAEGDLDVFFEHLDPEVELHVSDASGMGRPFA